MVINFKYNIFYMCFILFFVIIGGDLSNFEVIENYRISVFVFIDSYMCV